MLFFMPMVGLHGEEFTDLFGILLFMPNERAIISSRALGQVDRSVFWCVVTFTGRRRVVSLI